MRAGSNDQVVAEAEGGRWLQVGGGLTKLPLIIRTSKYSLNSLFGLVLCIGQAILGTNTTSPSMCLEITMLPLSSIPRSSSPSSSQLVSAT